MDVQAGILSFKAVIDLAGALIELSTSDAARQASAELLGKLTAAYQAQLGLIEANQTLKEKALALEAEIVRLTDWAQDTQNYELQEIGRGSVAYVFKPGAEPGQPVHWLCPNCYARRQKSFLMFQGQDRREDLYACAVCKTLVRVS